MKLDMNLLACLRRTLPLIGALALGASLATAQGRGPIDAGDTPPSVTVPGDGVGTTPSTHDPNLGLPCGASLLLEGTAQSLLAGVDITSGQGFMDVLPMGMSADGPRFAVVLDGDFELRFNRRVLRDGSLSVRLFTGRAEARWKLRLDVAGRAGGWLQSPHATRIDLPLRGLSDRPVVGSPWLNMVALGDQGQALILHAEAEGQFIRFDMIHAY